MNKFNANDERIYQVMQPSTDGNGAIENTPSLLADALQKEIPEVEYAASVIPSTWFPNKGLFSLNNGHGCLKKREEVSTSSIIRKFDGINN